MKTICWIVGFFLLCPQFSFADGGTIILRKQAGPLTISVFGSPEPLRVGAGDLSVMVQKSDDNSSVLDANVKLRLSHSSSEGISEVFAPATHANATNKLLYAARVNLPAQGVWKLVAIVDSKLGNAEVAGEINVMPPQPPIVAYWPYFAVVPLIIVLFVINQWLKSKRKIGSPRVRA
jgi:hypothetical protein